MGGNPVIGERIVLDAERAGFELRVSSDGAVLVRPRNVPRELREAIEEHRPAVVEALTIRERGGRGALERLEGLRVFAPSLFRTTHLRGVGPVLVWGVTPHGVVVSPAPGRPLLTVDPSELTTPECP